jgi:hypothetical protein
MMVKLDDERKLRALLQVFSGLRKIGDDLIFEGRADSISFRSLNETHSALPVIQILKPFFDEYRYTHVHTHLAYQLPSQWVITALRCTSHPTTTMFAISVDTNTMTITLFDAAQIKHEWCLYLEETSILNAVFEMSEVVATVQGRVDVFHETEHAFKRNERIEFTLRRRGRELSCILSSPEMDEKEPRLCTFTIQSNDNCDITFCDDRDEVSLSLSRSDFCVGLTISTVLSQRITVHCIGPGYPVMMKASMPNSMQFQMAIATGIGEEESPEKEELENEPLITRPDREDRRTVSSHRTFA